MARVKRLAPLLPLLGLLLVIGLLRWRLLQVPLERDEAEYTYTARAILRGVPPYTESYDPKVPGLHALYALMLLFFGPTPLGIRLGFLTCNLGSIALSYFLGRRVFAGDLFLALCCAASFALLTLSRCVLGFTANAEHFMLFCVILGLLLQWPCAAPTVRPWRLCVAGFAVGLTVTIKQPGMFFVAAGASCLLHDLWRRQKGLRGAAPDVLCFALSCLLPYGLMCLIMVALGRFGHFWYWTVTYTSSYATALPFRQGLINLGRRVVPMLPWAPLLLCALVGLCAPAFSTAARRRAVPLRILLFFSILAVCPGLYFRPHYFLLLAPALSLLCGEAAASLRPRLGRSLFLLLPLLLLLPVAIEWKYLFLWSPDTISRKTYFTNPFIEARALAAYIKEHTRPEERILIFGSEPEIYFYADRRAATRHIVVYPMTLRHPRAEAMQREYIADAEAAAPRYVVSVDIPWSWTWLPGAPQLLPRWGGRYIRSHYRPVVVAEVTLEGSTFVWGVGPSYRPRTKDSIWLWERMP